MPSRILVVNFKNYPEVMGRGSVDLAQAAFDTALKTGVTMIVAPPTPMISLVSSKVSVKIFSQSVGTSVGDKTTGAILPEAVKGAGGTGTILNHSESRMKESEVKSLVPRLRSLRLEVLLCAGTTEEASRLSRFGPEMLAIEPPELIGTGISVSTSEPGLVSGTVAAARKAGYKGKVLCGAGIVDAEDVRKAVELGAEGVLVSSSIVKAKDWRGKLEELSRSLI